MAEITVIRKIGTIMNQIMSTDFGCNMFYPKFFASFSVQITALTVSPAPTASPLKSRKMYIFLIYNQICNSKIFHFRFNVFQSGQLINVAKKRFATERAEACANTCNCEFREFSIDTRETLFHLLSQRAISALGQKLIA